MVTVQARQGQTLDENYDSLFRRQSGPSQLATTGDFAPARFQQRKMTQSTPRSVMRIQRRVNLVKGDKILRNNAEAGAFDFSKWEVYRKSVTYAELFAGRSHALGLKWFLAAP